MSALHVRLLGQFSVQRNGVPLDLGGPLPRALLLVLVAAGGRTVSVARLVDEMWDEPPPSAEAALASYVSRLRRTLEPERSPRTPSVLRHSGHGYALALDDDALDATAFRRLAAQGRRALQEGRWADADDDLSRSLALWTDDLPPLDDLPVSVRPEAVRLQEERLEAIENRAEARLRLGRHTALVGELEALVVSHPLRERLGQLLALALYRSGRQPEALTAIRRLVSRLDDDHGLEARPELRALEHAVLTQDPSLELAGTPGPNARPSPVVAPGRSRRPPAPLTHIVGREGLLDQVLRTLDAHRLVTLTGPAGAGKTRLAIEVAARLEGRSTAWAPLTEVAAAEDVDGCVVTAVGATAPAGVGARAALLTAVQDRALDVVLDNAEHVVSAVASCAAALVEAERSVRVLVTSRTPLGVPGERVIEVPPLSTETDGEQRSPALELFLERASAGAPGWDPDAEDLAAAQRVCVRLEGVPLALELAASRVRALSPLEILADLDQWPQLLVGGASSTPHHGSLAAALAWSDDLLSETDRQVFRAVGVFDGDFDLAAATAVVGEPIVGSMARLEASSLLVADRTARPRRYRLPHVLREWVRLQTAADERRVAQRALELWAGDLARRGAAGVGDLRTAGEWMARLDLERPNLMGALRSGLAAGDPVLALQTVSDLAPLWLRDRPREGLDLLLAALERAGALPEAPAEAVAEAHLTAANVAFAGLDVPRALELAGQTIALANDVGSAELAAEACATHSFLLLMTGDIAGAEAQAQQALREARPGTAGARTRGQALLTLGALAHATGDGMGSLALLDQAAKEWEDSAFWPLMLGGTMFAERIAVQAGHVERVVERSTRAVDLAAEIGAEVTMLQLLPALAGALLERGDPSTGGQLLVAAQTHARRVGLPQLVLDPGFDQWLDSRVGAVDPDLWAEAAAAGRKLDRASLLDLVAGCRG